MKVGDKVMFRPHKAPGVTASTRYPGVVVELLTCSMANLDVVVSGGIVCRVAGVRIGYGPGMFEPIVDYTPRPGYNLVACACGENFERKLRKRGPRGVADEMCRRCAERTRRQRRAQLEAARQQRIRQEARQVKRPNLMPEPRPKPAPKPAVAEPALAPPVVRRFKPKPMPEPPPVERRVSAPLAAEDPEPPPQPEVDDPPALKPNPQPHLSEWTACPFCWRKHKGPGLYCSDEHEAKAQTPGNIDHSRARLPYTSTRR